MVVARASGTDLASSLKQNEFGDRNCLSRGNQPPPWFCLDRGAPPSPGKTQDTPYPPTHTPRFWLRQNHPPQIPGVIPHDHPSFCTYLPRGEYSKGKYHFEVPRHASAKWGPRAGGSPPPFQVLPKMDFLRGRYSSFPCSTFFPWYLKWP